MTGEHSRDGLRGKCSSAGGREIKKKLRKKIVHLLLVLHSGGVIELPLSYLPSVHTEEPISVSVVQIS